ncbi:MAG: 50S ribosomal protein L6 [Parachlamydiaceae bacterium]|nr:50S ribosomal protein L6 [Parachlamydiaceae bacterium]
MARKGKLPVPLPKGVEVNITETNISVKGPKGTLNQKIVPGIQVTTENDQLLVSLIDEKSDLEHFQGLYRTLILNMVLGTTQGFEKRLEMIGVGYRASVQGNLLDLLIGFSHPTKLPIPQGLDVKVEKNTLIIISGFDKHLVGQFAATIRSKKPPEPYQGKGIRYVGEYVRKKAGKSAAAKK